MTKFIIVDLDNCIADDAWRIPKINWSKPTPMARYHDYHSLSGFDEIGNLRIFDEHADCGPIIFTARPALYQALTREWLARRGVFYERLLMRDNDDHRDSLELKRAMLLGLPEFYGIALEAIAAAYDDRQDIVEMYRSYKITAHRLEIHNVCAYAPPKKDFA